MLLASLVKRGAALNIEYCTFTRPIHELQGGLQSLAGLRAAYIRLGRPQNSFQTICTQTQDPLLHPPPLPRCLKGSPIRRFPLKMYTCNASIDIAASPEHVRSKVSLSSLKILGSLGDNPIHRSWLMTMYSVLRLLPIANLPPKRFLQVYQHINPK